MTPLEHKIKEIQKELKKHDLDGWLLYDHHGSNRFMKLLFSLPEALLLTRRFYIWIPKEGSVKKLVHAIEHDLVTFIPGETATYISKQDLETTLETVLKGGDTIAMEYSPYNDNPYLSVVDGGTIDLIKRLGKRVVSSGDLLLHFTSVLSDHALSLHEKAAQVLQTTVLKAFDYIREHLKEKKPITEYQVQTFILHQFTSSHLFTEEKPICAAGPHSASPHYTIDPENSSQIKEGDLVLIDLWGKEKDPLAVYGDLTRVGFVGKKIPPKVQQVFDLVLKAQESALELIRNNLENRRLVSGFSVDQVVRAVIEKGGYAPYFTHRTGHNIDQHLHGVGTHLDSIEAPDHRLLLPRCCFSIEPGIYLPGEFGIRLETTAYITDDFELKVTGGLQGELFTLL